MTLVELLRERNVPFCLAGEHHHVTSPDWVGVDCPYCSPGWSKFRMGITHSCRTASCWTCGRHPPIKAIAELTGLRPSEVFDKLGVDAQSYKSHTEKIQGKLVIPEGLAPLLPIHKEYLEGRGFDPNEIEETWGIKGTGIHGSLPWRLWIPIYLGYDLVSWTTRSLIDEGKRYINASAEEEKVSAKSIIYGEHLCGRSIIIVEGPMDVWRIGPGTGSTNGIKWTEDQALRIAKFARRMIVFDNEPEAQRQARKLAARIESFPGQTLVAEIETGKDPGDCSKKELKELRKWLD